MGVTPTYNQAKMACLENPERLHVTGEAGGPREESSKVGDESNSPLLCELNQSTASSQRLFVNKKINHSTGRGVAKEHGGQPPPQGVTGLREWEGTARA